MPGTGQVPEAGMVFFQSGPLLKEDSENGMDHPDMDGSVDVPPGMDVLTAFHDARGFSGFRQDVDVFSWRHG
jgi:hypothetical protein